MFHHVERLVFARIVATIHLTPMLLERIKIPSALYKGVFLKYGDYAF
jgi:hypothetical protein